MLLKIYIYIYIYKKIMNKIKYYFPEPNNSTFYIKKTKDD